MVEGKSFDLPAPAVEFGRGAAGGEATTEPAKGSPATVPLPVAAEAKLEVGAKAKADAEEEKKGPTTGAEETKGKKKGPMAAIKGGFNTVVGKAKALGHKTSEKIKEAKIGEKLKSAGNAIATKTKSAAVATKKGITKAGAAVSHVYSSGIRAAIVLHGTLFEEEARRDAHRRCRHRCQAPAALISFRISPLCYFSGLFVDRLE